MAERALAPTANGEHGAFHVYQLVDDPFSAYDRETQEHRATLWDRDEALDLIKIFGGNDAGYGMVTISVEVDGENASYSPNAEPVPASFIFETAIEAATSITQARARNGLARLALVDV